MTNESVSLPMAPLRARDLDIPAGRPTAWQIILFTNPITCHLGFMLEHRQIKPALDYVEGRLGQRDVRQVQTLWAETGLG